MIKWMRKHMVRALVVVAMLAVSVGTVMRAEEEPEVVKSLLQQLETATSPEVKMSLLEHLSDAYFGQPEERYYLQQLYEHSNGSSDYHNEFKAVAISHLCRYYYNIDDIDSLMIWSEKVDELRLEPNIYARYFDIKYFHCMGYLERDNTEKALGLALELQKSAQHLGSVDGEITCYELLGDVYMKTQVYDRAIDAYSTSFQILKKQDKRVTYQFQLLTQILECCHERRDYDTFEHYLNEMGAIFRRGGIGKNAGALYDRCLKLYYAYALLNGVKHDNDEQARKYYELLNGFKPIDDWFVEDRVTRTFSDYYAMNKNYDKALAQLNKLDSSEIDTKYGLLYSKGVLKQKLGRYDEAAYDFYQALDTLHMEYNKSVLTEFYQFQEICHTQYMTRVQKDYLAEMQRKRILYSLVGLTVMLVMLALFGYHVRRTRMLNVRLQKLENRLRRDETELLQRQEVLKDTLDRHMNNSRLKTMFLSNMSHEIRTPLNAIVGFSGLLVQNADDDDVQLEYAKIIESNSASLMALINNILDLGRLDSNRVSFNWQKSDLMSIITTSLDRYHLNDGGVEAIIDSPSEYIEIVTDQLRLSKVFDNIYSNAFKFTKKGYVKTIVKLFDRTISIRVEDTGIGVPAEKVHLVFERFEKIDTFSPGSGLGMPICKELINRMGGSIAIDEQYTNGFALEIVLPYIKSEI